MDVASRCHIAQPSDVSAYREHRPTRFMDSRDTSMGMASEGNDGSTREVEMYIGVSLVGLLVLVLLLVWLF
jgi:hypothetical protein